MNVCASRPKRCYGDSPEKHAKRCRDARPLCRWRRARPCTCDAYPFPHRGSGGTLRQHVETLVCIARSDAGREGDVMQDGNFGFAGKVPPFAIVRTTERELQPKDVVVTPCIPIESAWTEVRAIRGSVTAFDHRAATMTWWVVPLLLALFAIGCAPAPWEQRFGYYLDESPSYAFQAGHTTPGGIAIDTTSNADPEALAIGVDVLSLEVEDCFRTPLDRTAFRVLVPADWLVSCEGNEVLPFRVPDRMCKGEQATDACPCRYRALLQEPDLVITTPNLALFKDALVRLLTGSVNPWADPRLVRCVGAGVVTP